MKIMPYLGHSSFLENVKKNAYVRRRVRRVDGRRGAGRYGRHINGSHRFIFRSFSGTFRSVPVPGRSEVSGSLPCIVQ